MTKKSHMLETSYQTIKDFTLKQPINSS